MPTVQNTLKNSGRSLNMKNDKELKVNTTNYPKDSHAAFCKRCKDRYHEGKCPITKTDKVSQKCDL